MTKRKADKKIISLKPVFQNILICKKKENRPFLEILLEEPENISRKNLGTLVGIFQINDYCEDSSYIVNYLISIIKKEYFSHTNRSPVENFEAALHKANLALAGLATHENIGWIGHINAICAVIEKNNLLMAQTGTASAFLLRKTSLTEITENPAEQNEISPLKTFQDVISGKIEDGDKLIFTTKELFELFSFEEIKKSALKFSRDNFIQFLNTALVNELDQVATLVIDIAEYEELEIQSAPFAKTPQFNAFSQSAFRASKKPKSEKTPPLAEPTAKIAERQAPANDFVDQKTGHIYLKEELASEKDARPKIQLPAFDFSRAREKLALFISATGKSSRKFFVALVPKLKSKKEKSSDELEALVRSNLQKETGVETKMFAPEKRRSLGTSLRQISQTYAPKIKTKSVWLWAKFIDIFIIVLRWPVKGFLLARTFIKNKSGERTNRLPIAPTKMVSAENSNEKNIESFFSQKRRDAFSAKKTEGLAWTAKLKSLWPDFSKLKTLIEKFNSRQKISALVILFLLLVVPYWISQWERKLSEKAPAPVVEAPIVSLPLEKDKNVTRVPDLAETFAGENIEKIINLNGKLFALKDTELVDIENQKNISLPADFQNPELFFAMDDLNLLFFVKNKQLISLAPATGKFTPNSLTFPENTDIVSAQTYLTYAYLFDAKNNQIYRYPRAEGGFGEKTNWLKEELALPDIKSMAINENVFLANSDRIIKLFRGKKLDFSIEETATPISITKIYTKRDLPNLYILDKANARIIKLDAAGQILAQYYNAKIAEADDFAINAENNLVYLLNKNGVESFKMD